MRRTMVKHKDKTNSPAHWTLPRIDKDAHKYSRGHVLVLGGAELTGASRLAALAAARIGAGLVTLAAPREVWPIYAASLLSIIARPLDDMQGWQTLLADERVTAAIIGPGAGTGATTTEAIAMALEAKKKLVLDADALNVLAKDSSLRKKLSADIVLTPHEGEYEKLAKALRLDTTAEKSVRATALAKALGCIVVLKGSETVIATADGKLLLNRNAPPWLATGGTGDVLAGMIGGLFGQGMKPFDAAAAAVWLHGEAGAKLGRGLLAEDLPGKIPEVLQSL